MMRPHYGVRKECRDHIVAASSLSFIPGTAWYNELNSVIVCRRIVESRSSGAPLHLNGEFNGETGPQALYVNQHVRCLQKRIFCP